MKKFIRTLFTGSIQEDIKFLQAISNQLETAIKKSEKSLDNAKK